MEKIDEDGLNHQNKRNTAKDKKKNNKGFPYKNKTKNGINIK